MASNESVAVSQPTQTRTIKRNRRRPRLRPAAARDLFSFPLSGVKCKSSTKETSNVATPVSSAKHCVLTGAELVSELDAALSYYSAPQENAGIVSANKRRGNPENSKLVVSPSPPQLSKSVSARLSRPQPTLVCSSDEQPDRASGVMQPHKPTVPTRDDQVRRSLTRYGTTGSMVTVSKKSDFNIAHRSSSACPSPTHRSNSPLNRASELHVVRPKHPAPTEAAIRAAFMTKRIDRAERDMALPAPPTIRRVPSEPKSLGHYGAPRRSIKSAESSPIPPPVSELPQASQKSPIRRALCWNDATNKARSTTDWTKAEFLPRRPQNCRRTPRLNRVQSMESIPRPRQTQLPEPETELGNSSCNSFEKLHPHRPTDQPSANVEPTPPRAGMLRLRRSSSFSGVPSKSVDDYDDEEGEDNSFDESSSDKEEIFQLFDDSDIGI